MESYREKQVEKEKAIVEDGRYNYLRLTDNDFGQLMSAIADIRYGEVVNDPAKGIYIYESAMDESLGSVMIGTVQPGGKNYIIPRRMLKNTFVDDDEYNLIFGNTEMDNAFTLDENGNLVVGTTDSLIEATKEKFGSIRYKKIVFNKNNSEMRKLADKLKEDRVKKEDKKRKERAVQELSYACILAKAHLNTYSDLFCLNDTTIVEVKPYDSIDEFTLRYNADLRQLRKDINMNDVVLESADILFEEYIRPIGRHMHLMHDDQGFYISSEDPKYSIASPYYDTDEEVPQSMIDTMDDIYEANAKKVGGINERR
jgi:hypothetical protein